MQVGEVGRHALHARCEQPRQCEREVGLLIERARTVFDHGDGGRPRCDDVRRCRNVEQNCELADARAGLGDAGDRRAVLVDPQRAVEEHEEHSAGVTLGDQHLVGREGALREFGGELEHRLHGCSLARRRIVTTRGGRRS